MMSDLVRGQRALDSMKADIESFIAIVNAFLRQASRSVDQWDAPGGFSVEDFFTIWIDTTSAITIIRDSKEIRRASDISIGDVHLIHRRISKGVEGLMESLGFTEEFAAFSKPFLRDTRQRLVVTRRPSSNDDFHACIDGRPEIWGCGKSQSEAIGDMVQSHVEIFGITIDNTAVYANR